MKLKSLLRNTFHMKDLGDLNYFLGIMEFTKSSQGIFISQRKYPLDLLREYGVDKPKISQASIRCSCETRASERNSLVQSRGIEEIGRSIDVSNLNKHNIFSSSTKAVYESTYFYSYAGNTKSPKIH